MATSPDARIERLRQHPEDRGLFLRTLSDLEGEGQAHRLVEAYRVHAAAAPRAESVRLWLTVAERWGAADAQLQKQAWEQAIRAAWQHDHAMLGCMVEDWEARGEHEPLQAALAWQMRQHPDPEQRARSAARLAARAGSEGRWSVAAEALLVWAQQEPGEATAALARLDGLHDAGMPQDLWERTALPLSRIGADDRARLRVLEARIRSTWASEPDEAWQLTLEAAPMAFRATGDVENAAALIHRLLDQQPQRASALHDWMVAQSQPRWSDSPDGLETLVRCAELAQRWPDQAAWLERLAALQTAPSARAQALMRRADVQAMRLQDAEAALQGWSEAARLQPGLEATVRTRLQDLQSGTLEPGQGDRILQAQRALLERQGDWAGVHALLRPHAQNRAGAEGARRWNELAELEYSRLGRPDMALSSWARAAHLGTDVEREEAIDGLQHLLAIPGIQDEAAAELMDLYAAAGRWPDLAKLRRRQVEQAGDAQVRAQLLSELARLEENQLQQPAAAAQTWIQAAELRPTEPHAWEEARRLLGSAGAWDAVLALLQQEAERTPSADRQADLLARQVALWLDPRQDEAAALQTAWSGLQRYPGHPGLQQALADVLAPQTSQGTLDRALDTAVVRGDHEAAIGLAQLAARAVGSSTPRGVALALRATEWAPHDAQLSGAALQEARALGERPLVLEALVAHARAAGMAGLWREAASLQSEDNAIDEAIKSLEKALALEPTAHQDWLALAALQARAGQPEREAVSLERALALHESGGAAGHGSRRRLAGLREPSAPVEAARLWAQVLRDDPEDAGATAGLQRCSEACGDVSTEYQALRDTLDRVTDRAEASRRMVRLADLAAQEGAPAELSLSQLIPMFRDEDADPSALDAATRQMLEHPPFGSDTLLEEPWYQAVVLRAVRLDPPDEALQCACDQLDRLVDARRLPDAVALGVRLMDRGLRGGALWDRLTQWASRLEDTKTAWACSKAWYADAPEELPTDRLAGHAVRALIEAPADAVEPVVTVLRQDSGQPELRLALDALGQDPGLTLAEALASTDLPAAWHQAALLWQRLAPDQPELAEAQWERLLARDGQDRSAMRLLAGSLRARGATEGLRTLLLQRAEAATEEDEQLDTWRALAELAPDEEERLSWLQRCVQADLLDVESRAALATIFRAQESWSELVVVLEELAGLSEDPVETASLLTQMASVWEERLQATDRAIEALRQATDAQPSDPALWAELARLHRVQGNWEACAGSLDRLASLQSDIDERIATLRDLATLQETHLESPRRAVEALERVLALEPANLPVLEECVRLLGACEDWDAELRMLERMAQSTTIAALRAEVLLRASRTLSERLGRHADALALLASAAPALEPDPTLIERVMAVGRAAALPVPTASLLRDWVPRMPEGTGRTGLALQIATLLADDAGEVNAALHWLLEQFRLAPGPGPLLDRAESLSESGGHDGLRAQFWRTLLEDEAADPDVRWRAYSTLAELAEAQPEGATTAFGLMVRAASEDALRARAESALESIASRHGLWEEHRNYLGAIQEDAASDADRLATALRKATFEESSMGNWEAAFDTLIDAFQEDPFEEAIRTPLLRLAREHGAWSIVFKLHEVLVASSTDPATRSRLLASAADIASTDDTGQDSLTLRVRAWSEHPMDTAAEEAMLEAARAEGRWEEVLGAWEAWVDQQEDPEERRRMLHRLVSLACEAEVVEAALGAWSLLFEYPDEAREALDACDGWMSERGARDALGDAIVGVLPRLHEARLRVDFLVRRAAIARQSGDTEAMKAAWRHALTVAPDDADLHDGKTADLEAAGLWEDVVESLTRWAACVTDATVRRRLRERLAEVCRDRLSNPRAALVPLSQLLPSDPDREGAEDQLIALHRELEDWDALNALLVDLAAAAAAGSPLRTRRRMQAAQLLLEQGAEPSLGLKLLDDLGADGQTAQVLELRTRLLAAAQQWTAYVEALRALAGITEGHEAAVALGQAAEAWESQLVHPDRAVTSWRQALQHDPAWTRASAELARLLEELGDTEGALEVLQACWARLEAMPERGRDAAEACVRLAALTEDEALQAQLLAAAVEADPRHPTARGLWEEALQRSGGMDRLLTLLDEELSQATDDATRAEVLVRRAQTLFLDGGREAEARIALRRAGELAFGTLQVPAVLGDMAWKQERWSEALSAWEALGDEPATVAASRLPRARRLSPDEVIDGRTGALYASRRAMALERVGRPEEAWEAWTGILLEDETWPPALAALARLSVARSNWAAAAVHVSNYMRHADAAPRVLTAQVNLLAARIAEQEGHADTAIAFYDRVSQSTEGEESREAIERAVDAALRAGDHVRAVPRLRRLVELADRTEDRIRALLRLGQALADADPLEAAQTVTQAWLLMESDHPELDRTLEHLMELVSGEALLQTLDRLEAESEGAKQARIQLARSRALGSVSRWTEAAAAAAAALEALPWSAAALDAAVEFHRQSGQAEGLVACLERALSHCEPDAIGPRAALMQALGDAQWHGLDRPEDALATYQALRRLTPDSVAVLSTLLELFDIFEDSDAGEALDVASELVHLGALSEPLLRSLISIHQSSGNLDAVVQSLQVLLLAGSASEDEQALLARLPQQTPRFEAGALGGALHEEWLRPAELPESTARCLAHATHVWLAANPTPRPGEQVQSARPEMAVWGIFGELVQAFGVEGTRLLIDPDQSRAAVVVAGSPAIVQVSRQLATSTDESSIRFALGRALAMVRPEFLMLSSLSTLDGLGFFEAALLPNLVEAPPLDASLQRVVQRWKDRLGPIAPAEGVTRDVRESFGSLASWRQLMEDVAIRSAVMASFSSAHGLMQLTAELDEPMPRSVEDLQRLVQQHGSIKALVGWVLSDRYLALRRQLGLSFGG